MTNFESVRKFMKTFGQEIKEKAEFPNNKITTLRYDLIKEELDELIDSRSTPTREAFTSLKRRLNIRANEPCFHPEAAQRVLDTPPGIFAIERGPLPNGRRLMAIYNISDTRQPLEIGELDEGDWYDVLKDGKRWSPHPEERDILRPYRSLWLVQP